MRSLPELDADILVIGHGAAGSLCASLLASRGNRVLVIGKGTSATSMSPGGLSFGQEEDASGVTDFLLPRLKVAGLEMAGDLGATTEVMTNMGTFQSVSFAPRYTYGDILSGGKNVAILGILGHPDLDPDLACAMVTAAHPQVRTRPYWTRLEVARDDMDPQDPEYLFSLEELEDQLACRLTEMDEDIVALPPLFGLDDQCSAMSGLERRTGKRVFEPLTPLSIPGMRFQQALERMMISSGCQLMKGREMIGVEASRGEASSITVRSGGRTHKVDFSCLVLAHGGLMGGGLVVQGKGVADPLSCFQLERTMAGGVSSLALSEAMGFGLKVDESYRAFSTGGERMENVFAIGSVLPGVSPPMGKGLAQVMLSSWKAAGRVAEAL